MAPEPYAMLAGCIMPSWNENGSPSRGPYVRSQFTSLETACAHDRIIYCELGQINVAVTATVTCHGGQPSFLQAFAVPVRSNLVAMPTTTTHLTVISHLNHSVTFACL